MSSQKKYYLTFDTDWAPEFVLQDIITRLEKRNCRATFFATNPSNVLLEAEKKGIIEIAWHPNFNPNSSHGATTDEVLSTLKKWYPNATGFRSHGLVQSSNILRKAADYGLKYDSNLLLYDFEMIRPIKTFYNLVRFPYHWSDASNLLWNRENDLSELGLDFEGLKIYDFHPILIYLNEAKLNTHYNKLKAGSTKNLVDLTKNDIDPFIQSSDKGVGNLFDSFLEYIHGNNHITQTLHQLFLSAE